MAKEVADDGSGGFGEFTTEIDLTKDGKEVQKRSSSEGDDFEVSIEDDTPEGDRNRPRRAPGTKSAVPDDDEIGQYTKGVQDRLKQMRWEYHEERRAKEQWQREHGAAIDMAKKVYAENKALREMVTKGHKTLLESNKSAGESEISALKQSLAVALETGDTKQAAELNAKIAAAAARVEATSHIAPISFPESTSDGKDGREVPRQRQEVKLSRAMQDWMDDNPWFNDNKRMTAYAFGVHEELAEKGIALESPRYFAEIDKAMRNTFRDYFADDEEDDDDRNDDRRSRSARDDGRDRRGSREERDQETSRRSPARRTAVAGVSRSPAGRASGKVTLTQSEAAVARRMGITPEQYAREKIRLEKMDG